MNYRILSRMLFKPLESLYINMPPEKIGGVIYSTWIFNHYSSERNWRKLFY